MLTVLFVAYPLAPVAPDTAGGAEQVLATLDAALVRAGGRSIVVASEGSTVAGRLVPIEAERGPLDAAARVRAEARVRAAIRAALASSPVDVVHFHGLDFTRYEDAVPPDGPPTVATLHLPLDGAHYDLAALHKSRARRVCVSAAQAGSAPDGVDVEVIENGVVLGAPSARAGKRPYVLALGRICPEKGFDDAARAAQLAGAPLVIAGRLFSWEAHERWYRASLAPFLDGTARRFVGPVGGARKRRLLAGARALLVPSRVAETSSLVAMEALAAGTPVIAYPAGALPSIVEDGRTGFLVDRVEAMAAAIGRAGAIDPGACRAAAEARFDAGRMCEAYFALYRQIAVQRPVHVMQHVVYKPLPGPLALDEIEGLAALTALEPAWADLWSRAPDSTPFSHPAWLLPYARAFAPHARALVLRDGERLAALLPFVCDHNVARLLGEPVTDYLDALIDPALAPDGAARLLAALCSRFPACELDELHERSPLLHASAPPGVRDEIVPTSICAVVPLDAAPSRKLARALRQGRARLEAEGELRHVRARTPDEAAALLAALFSLHAGRWHALGAPGLLDDPAVRRFHREAASALAAADLLALDALTLSGRPIAVAYGLRGRRAVHEYLGGFDPAFRHAGPGSLILAAVAEGARADGLVELDLLRGREPYKYRWGARDRPNRRRRLTS